MLVVTLAYALAVQALMTSIGLGMSTFAAPAQGGLVICSHISPAPGSEGQKRRPAPQCPFCLVAAFSAGNLALTDEAPALPAYSVLPLELVAGHFGEPPLISQRHRTVGAPRAPPAFSV
ncbi:MAG: hypothetical protein WBD33_09905 [Xanthobacteraceae bacterium]